MTEETTIDWSAPLEAYHPDGRVVEVTRQSSGGCLIFPHLDVDGGRNFAFEIDGSHDFSDWRIRNRRPTASEHPEGYSPELVERMEESIRRAERKLSAYVGICMGDKELTGAVLPMLRSILSELDKSKEVDPLVEGFNCLPPEWDEAIFTKSLRSTFDRLGYELRKKDEAA